MPLPGGVVLSLPNQAGGTGVPHTFPTARQAVEPVGLPLSESGVGPGLEGELGLWLVIGRPWHHTVPRKSRVTSSGLLEGLEYFSLC